MTTAPTASLAGLELGRFLEEAARIAGEMSRADLASRLVAAGNRCARPQTVIAVVGEFKSGKSSLVNGLLGEDICPVDDDIATAALTVVTHGPEPSIVLRATDGAGVKAAFTGELAARAITERGRADHPGEVAWVEVQLDNAFLARGIVLVDTPGVGGLTPGYAAMTLGYLHVADALLFVSDASAPLSAAEVAFLKQAMQECPSVLLALSKADLYPEWRRIRDTDLAILAENGLSAIPIVPVSSVLRMLAFIRRDATLNEESGYPALLNEVAAQVLDPARSQAATRARAELASAVEQLGISLVTEEGALKDPATTAQQVTKLNAERDRLERIRAGGARWQTMLSDQFGDLVADVEHRFRQAMRKANRDADETIEAVDPADAWDTLAGDARRKMSEATIALVRDLEMGADQIAASIVEVLREDDLAFDAAVGKAKPLEVGTLWSARAPEAKFIVENVASGWASLRGAQSGILVFGMLSSLAGIALTAGAMAGLGVVFGGKQLLDERKRQVTARRQKARTAIRQFFDDVQFEVGKSMRDLSRELQRQLRDHFNDRISERIRSCAATAESLRNTMQQDEAQRRARLTQINGLLEALARIHHEAAALPPGGVA